MIDPVTQRPYRYRLNGLIVYGLTIAVWGLACSSGWLAWDFFWTTRWEGLAGACVFGLLFTLAIVLTAPPTGKGLLADIFLGRAANPQWLSGRIDAKMWLYLIGATMLGLNLYSFAMHHAANVSQRSLLGRCALCRALHVFPYRISLLRARAPLHVRLLRRERRLQARLGLPRASIPISTRVGLWSRRGSAEPAPAGRDAGRCCGLVLPGLVSRARREHAEIPLQARSDRELPRLIAPKVLTDGEHASSPAASGASRAT